MLYLFGRLALNDSLSYHEDYEDDYPENNASSPRPAEPEPAPQAAGGGLPLRYDHLLPPPGQAATSCPHGQ